MLYKQPSTPYVSQQGPFTIRCLFPGYSLPNPNDHGYGPLAAVDDATLKPGTLVGMHEHRNDEIVSYVHQGAMRHSDSSGAKLNIDPHNLMVMNAGSSFWHEERVRAGDDTTRTLQIFIRPHTVNLEPQLHHLELLQPHLGSWRYLVGPDGSDAPTTVRNDIKIFDGHFPQGTSRPLPMHEGWDAYFVVLQGEIEVHNQSFTAVESGLLVDEEAVNIQVQEDALVVLFLINRDAQVTREGTIGH